MMIMQQKNRKKKTLDYFPVLQTNQTNCLTTMKFGFESFSTFFDVFFLGRKSQKAASYKAGKIKKIDFCSAARFSLVQGIKHPLSNKVFIGSRY